MKFIGQFIQDFIARFRSDVYLEAVESGTIASGGNLGLDSNNKIVKAAEVGSSVDLASEVTGVLPVPNGGTGNSTLTSTGVLTGNGTGAIVSNSTMSYSGELLTMSSTSSAKPQIALVNGNADAEAPSILFQKTETGAANDDIGLIEFRADNDAGQSNKFATIVGEIETATDGSEGGNLIFNVASHDGELNQGIKISDGTTEDQLDVDIANGVGSTTNIAGSLFFGASDGTPHTIGLNAHDDGDGGGLTIRAGSATAGTSNANGGNLNFNAGLSTGGMFGGDFVFNTSYRGSSGSSLNSNFDIFKISPDIAGGGGVGFQVFGEGSTSDYFAVTVGGDGATELSTIDADAASANLTINADGNLTENCVNYSLDASGSITLDSPASVSFFENGVSRYRFLVDSTPEVDITGDFTIDCTGNVEINADGGTIDFKDGTAQLAKIDSGGFRLTDNAGAGITFEGDTDDDHQMTLKGGEPTADRTINLPDATGTVQLQGENTGQVVHFNLKDLGSYIFYLFHDDNWYSAGSGTLAILGNSTLPSSISSTNSFYQSRVAAYVAPSACTLKKLCFTFYWSSSVVNAADIDFAFSKFTPISDGTSASITMNSITATDHNGSYTEIKPYYKTFTFSGANASLAAGDAFAFHMRTTGGSSSQRVIVYGTATVYLELD